MTIQEAINQLQAYQGPYELTLHPGAGEDLLTAVESAYGITLPDDFKALYRFSDGFETDEDIFNMIPLTEIRNNKDRDSPLYIAEYSLLPQASRLWLNAFMILSDFITYPLYHKRRRLRERWAVYQNNADEILIRYIILSL